MHLTMRRKFRGRIGFTLMELMVVIAIVVILMAVSAPLLKSLSKSNGASSSVNLVRAFLSNARATAIAQHRQVGVVFFEETAGNAGVEMHANQTAMQLILEQSTQVVGSTVTTTFTNFDTNRQYFPLGVVISTLNIDSSGNATGATAQNTANQTRVIIFDANGQMVLREGVAETAPGTGLAGTYPRMCADWNLIGTTTPSITTAVSSPGLLIYNKADYDAQNFSSDANRWAWLQANAQILIVNTYTGGIIRGGGITQ